MWLGTWHKYIICKNMFHIITEIEYFCRYFIGAQSGSYNNNKQIKFARFRYSFIYTKINTINQNEGPALLEAELVYLE